MEKKSKKTIIIGITSLLLVTLILLGLTYAYYRTRIIGNDAETSISVTSKKLEIVYGDGTGTITATGIEPGYTATKTFTVENTGDDTVSYAVYLEDVVNTYTRTQDWTYEVTCSPDCSGTDGEVEYPTLSEMIVENSIASGVTQTYSVTLKYANLETEDQSDDMGATISGRFQIYSPEDVVDIEGTVANASEGDYVQINSVKKVSQIVNGKYKLAAVEVGSHTLTVRSSDGTVKGSTTLTINKGTQGISGSTITMDENSETVTLNITSIASSLGIEIKKIKEKFVNPYTEGTLAYAILNDNEVTEPLTSFGTPSLENEKVLSETKDFYGTTYYFRGAVENNYVNFSGMCWRVVRIQGDGTIKIVLADENGECDANTYSKDNSTSSFISNSIDAIHYQKQYFEEYDYDEYEHINEISNWATKKNVDKTKLTTTQWCEDYAISDKSTFEQDETEYTDLIYMPSVRLYTNPSLMCDSAGIDNTKATKVSNVFGILTADEIVLAGGSSKANTTYYLYANASEGDGYCSGYWTSTPDRFDGAMDQDSLMVVGGNHLSACEAYGSLSVRPAIVLKSDVTVTTNSDTTTYGEVGTYTNPYVIS